MKFLLRAKEGNFRIFQNERKLAPLSFLPCHVSRTFSIRLKRFENRRLRRGRGNEKEEKEKEEKEIEKQKPGPPLIKVFAFV